jgi:hypothetical protein
VAANGVFDMFKLISKLPKCGRKWYYSQVEPIEPIPNQLAIIKLTYRPRNLSKIDTDELTH